MDSEGHHDAVASGHRQSLSQTSSNLNVPLNRRPSRAAADRAVARLRASQEQEDDGDRFDMVPTTVTFLGQLCAHRQIAAMEDSGEGRTSIGNVMRKLLARKTGSTAAEAMIARGDTQCWKCRAGPRLDRGLGWVGKVLLCQKSDEAEDGGEGEGLRAVRPVHVSGRDIQTIEDGHRTACIAEERGSRCYS